MTDRQTERAGPSPAGALLAATIGLALALACPARGQDPPHWTSTTIDIDCTSTCHVDHHDLGGRLTAAASNVNLCQSCHTASGLAGDLPIDSADLAVPGTGGTSHAFDVAAVNAGLDTQAPLDTKMLKRVMDGNVVCSTCHNQHRAESTNGGRSRVSPARRTTGLSSTGSVTSGGVFGGAAGVWYLVEITQAGSETTARFRYSKDNGLSWFPEQQADVDVPLDSGVTVTFTAGSFTVGERWEFSGSWFFLRVPLDDGDNASGDKYCRDCHRSWEMDHIEVETWDGSVRSHPVGVALDANGHGYDRATPLDGNGAVQGSPLADANPTNDLGFDSSSLVQCVSCHGLHHVDSNTQTVDEP